MKLRRHYYQHLNSEVPWYSNKINLSINETLIRRIKTSEIIYTVPLCHDCILEELENILF